MPSMNIALTIFAAAVFLTFNLLLRISIVAITDMVKKLRHKTVRLLAEHDSRSTIVSIMLLLLIFAATALVGVVSIWGIWGWVM